MFQSALNGSRWAAVAGVMGLGCSGEPAGKQGPPDSEPSVACFTDVLVDGAPLDPPYADGPDADGLSAAAKVLPLAASSAVVTLVGLTGSPTVDGTVVSLEEGSASLAVPLEGRLLTLGCSGSTRTLTLELSRGAAVGSSLVAVGMQGEWGTALAAAAGQVVVTAPRSGSGGEVNVYSASELGLVAAMAGDNLADAYGGSVALSDSLLVIGAGGASVGEGAIYISAADGAGGWGPPIRFSAPDPGQLSVFGLAVAILGDRILVGAPGLDSGGALGAGGVYVLAQAEGSWVVEAIWTPSDLSAFEAFGTSLSVDGDQVAIGAPGLRGRVAVATLASGPTWVADMEGQGGERLGETVLIHDGTLYAGAPNTPCASGAGSACGAVWQAGGPQIQADSPRSRARFGAALAAAGDLLVVGAPGEADRAGAVHILGFGQSTGQHRLITGEAARGRFGSSLALADQHLWIGAPYSDTPLLLLP